MEADDDVCMGGQTRFAFSKRACMCSFALKSSFDHEVTVAAVATSPYRTWARLIHGARCTIRR